MLDRIHDFVKRLAKEPPFRVLTQAIIKRSRPSLRDRVLWEISPRPSYLLGVYTAARIAREHGVKEIAAIEFGVAGGAGLVALQAEAEAVESVMGVGVRVFGFDSGSGLPEFTAGYRDHPEFWSPGDFPMDLERLRPRLTSRTTLVLGNVSATVTDFFSKYLAPPIGFIAFDLDLYSSTRDALRIFSQPDTMMLKHVPLYFDDTDGYFNHRFAGELLAIDEFNHESTAVKIDFWRGLKSGTPFPEHRYFEKMYMAHDLRSTCNASPRPTRTLPLEVPGDVDNGQAQLPASQRRDLAKTGHNS
jgi:hypothetical protein